MLFRSPAHTRGIDIQEGADVNAQMHYLKSKPVEIYRVVARGFEETFPMLYNTYIGVLGWLDTRLPTLSIYLGYFAILLILLYENGQYQAIIKAKQRILLLLVGLLLTFLIYLSQYLTWVSVGAAYCGSIQGRYFIPVFPLIFIGFIFFGVKKRLLLTVSLVASLWVLSAALYAAYDRYYGFKNAQILDIQCDAEEIWRDEYIGEVYFYSNIDGQMFFNGTSRSEEKARSGRYSAKLSPQANYTFTYKLYNTHLGDTVRTEVWYLGENASLWLVNSKKNVYLAENKPSETDAKGWKKLVLTHVIDSKLEGEEVAVFVENHSISYFDDFRIMITSK